MPRMSGTMQQWLAAPEHRDGDARCNASFARQAIETLACLHEHGYAHNDVHASNFLYQEAADGCPRWYLGDFELLAPATPDSLTEDWRNLGTPLYMLERGLEAETRGDRYSYGLGRDIFFSADPERTARDWLRAHRGSPAR